MALDFELFAGSVSVKSENVHRMKVQLEDVDEDALYKELKVCADARGAVRTYDVNEILKHVSIISVVDHFTTEELMEYMNPNQIMRCLNRDDVKEYFNLVDKD